MNINEYEIYFEVYGKKMKVKVSAQTEKDAKQKVKDKIIFHKIEVDNSVEGIIEKIKIINDSMDIHLNKMKEKLNNIDES